MKKINILIALITISSCAISPGMHMSTEKNWVNDNEYVFVESLNKKIKIQNINKFEDHNPKDKIYIIGNGDQIAIMVWGIPEVFPLANISPDQNLRRVDSNGDIFFPYAGIVKASGKTQKQLRSDLTQKLSKYFNNPQLDVSIAKFNSKQIFILGEVTKPKKINLTDIPITLSDALGESFGINTLTASGSEVYVIRLNKTQDEPEIYSADLNSPSGFIDAGNFYLKDNDIIYVNANGTARWNRVISQFFPFSTFLNSIDNLTSGD